MKKLYLNVAKKLDQTTLSFIIGLLSGWLISLLTGTLANTWFKLASASVLLCVISNFSLQLVNNSIREHTDGELKQEENNRLRENYEPKSYQQIRERSYWYKRKWFYQFLISFFVGFSTFILSILFVVIGNFKMQKEAERQSVLQTQIKKKLDSISSSQKNDHYNLLNISAKMDTLLNELHKPNLKPKLGNNRK
jgi:hypothetical protein